MYLGISAYNHQSAAALINEEGELINYYREEQLSRIKGDNSFPKNSIKKLFETNSLKIDDIKNVIFYEKPLSAYLNPLKVAAKNLPESLNLISHQLKNFKKTSLFCFVDLAKAYPGLEQKLLYIDHHLSHTLSALAYAESFKNICSVVADGFGDRSTTSISFVNNPNEIKELWSCDYPFSLGLFYSAITDFLGFAINEGEYKVMGLAAFGIKDRIFYNKMNKLIFWDKNEKTIKMDLSFFEYHKNIYNSFSIKLEELFGSSRNPLENLDVNNNDFQRYANIAFAAQEVLTNILKELFRHAHHLTGCSKFLFSGGVALNSASLRSIASLSFVERIYIPPSPGDSGAAIGAAYFGFIKNNKNNSFKKITNLYPTIFNSNSQYKKTIKIVSEKFEYLSKNMEESFLLASELIKEGATIGTLISNAETGPRALGNRSLICNGQNLEAVSYLNTVIKDRSPFRPTAPAMQETTAKKYFILDEVLNQSYLSMTSTVVLKENSPIKNYPIIHIDGTARLQIVEPDSTLDKLLLKLRKYDIEILANSSLNISGDPTCYDLIDGLMVCELSPLKYLLTDYGLLKKLN